MVGGKIKAEGFFEPTAEREETLAVDGGRVAAEDESRATSRNNLSAVICFIPSSPRVPFCSRRVGGTSQGTSMLGWGNEKSPTAMY